MYYTRHAIKKFRIVYYRRQKYSRRQNLVTGFTADVCQHVAESVGKCIAAGYYFISLLERDSLADYQHVTKRVGTFSADIII